jgi:hypothetical protein
MHFLNRILLEIGQDEQQPISWCGQRAVGVGDRTIAISDVPISGRTLTYCHSLKKDTEQYITNLDNVYC